MISAQSPLLSCILALASIGILLAAALHDMAARTVPNWMAAALAVIGLASQIVHGRPVIGIVAALIVFMLAAFCWRRGWLGGGDVKLLGAAALVVPPADVAPFIAAVAIAGAILAIAYLGARHITPAPGAARPQQLVARALRAERWRIRRGGPLPYAFAIAAGFMFISL